MDILLSCLKGTWDLTFPNQYVMFSSKPLCFLLLPTLIHGTSIHPFPLISKFIFFGGVLPCIDLFYLFFPLLFLLVGVIARFKSSWMYWESIRSSPSFLPALYSELPSCFCSEYRYASRLVSTQPLSPSSSCSFLLSQSQPLKALIWCVWSCYSFA